MTKYIDPTAKLMGHIDRIAAIKAGGHPAPVNVEIDLTNRCNLGCDDCHFAHVHTRGPLANRHTHDSGDQFDYPLVDQVMHQLWSAGVRSVTWTGGGEPTLHKFFDAVIEDCPLPQGLYTNGTLIDEARADLLKRRMEWVYVSLDCHTPETYKAYKKVDAFERACAGIRLLGDSIGRATVGVGYLIGSDNWQHIPVMVEHGLSLGADYVNFRPIINFRADRPGMPSEDLGWITNAVKALEAVHGNPRVIADAARFEMYANWTGHGYPACYWAQMQTVITPDARVWTCVNRRGFPGDALGDLHQESFSEIWKRSAPKTVDHNCRAMCRGHLPNLTLDAMLAASREHKEFI